MTLLKPRRRAPRRECDDDDEDEEEEEEEEVEDVNDAHHVARCTVAEVRDMIDGPRHGDRENGRPGATIMGGDGRRGGLVQA